jgi:hypothetical protein
VLIYNLSKLVVCLCDSSCVWVVTSFCIYFSIFNYFGLSKGRVLTKCMTGIIGGMKIEVKVKQQVLLPLFQYLVFLFYCDDHKQCGSAMFRIYWQTRHCVAVVHVRDVVTDHMFLSDSYVQDILAPSSNFEKNLNWMTESKSKTLHDNFYLDV